MKCEEPNRYPYLHIIMKLSCGAGLKRWGLFLSFHSPKEKCAFFFERYGPYICIIIESKHGQTLKPLNNTYIIFDTKVLYFCGLKVNIDQNMDKMDKECHFFLIS